MVIDFQLVLDNDNVSPFDENSMTDKFILEAKNSKIQISQKDWRGDHFIYELSKNGNKIFEFKLSKIEVDRSVELTINNIKINL